MKQHETRTFTIAATEVRAAKGAAYVLEGRAASYAPVLSKDLGGFREQIRKNAFSRSLKAGADVKALLNHDPSKILGRVKNGSLVLSESDFGLDFKLKLNPEVSTHRDLFQLVKRGDLTECSFAFALAPNGDTWDTALDADGRSFRRRTLKDVDLLDISIVTEPAYGGAATNVSARSGVRMTEDEVRNLRIASATASVQAEDDERRRKCADIGRVITAEKAEGKL